MNNLAQGQSLSPGGGDFGPAGLAGRAAAEQLLPPSLRDGKMHLCLSFVFQMHSSARHLVFHGAVVLLFGLLLGAPYARAINGNVAPHIVNSWRVAHLSLPIGAILMFAIAAVLSSLAVPPWTMWFIAVALIVSAYGFCVSTPLAALSGQRGLGSDSVGLGKVVYLGNMVGALASLLAALALVAAAFFSL